MGTEQLRKPAHEVVLAMIQDLVNEIIKDLKDDDKLSVTKEAALQTAVSILTKMIIPEDAKSLLSVALRQLKSQMPKDLAEKLLPEKIFLGISEVKVLFQSYDDTEHVYTWDYRKYQNAVQLFDLEDNFFLLIILDGYDDQETGAMGDGRSGSDYVCLEFSKETFQQSKTISHKFLDPLLINLKETYKDRGLSSVKKIVTPQGTIFIKGTDLILLKI
jgi:hypothetical protein